MSGFGPPSALMRDLVGRILDISPSGCLIESRRRMEVGTVGRLQMKFGNEACADDFEVVRCEIIDRARSVYHVGARFLPTTPRRAGSIRQAVTQYVDDLSMARPGWVM